jgi:hypothetical protein
VAAADPRWRVVHTPARGIVAALNAAAGLARSPVLARMDADDVAHPARLERQLARLRADPSLDVLGTQVELFGAAANAGMRAYVAWLNGLQHHDEIARQRFVESPLAHPSVALRAAVFQRLGGYRAFDGPEDYDLWLRALQDGARFAVLPEVLLRWRDGPARLTRTDPRYSTSAFFALKLAAMEAGPLAARPPIVIWGAGPIGKRWAKALAARGHRLAAFADVHPRRLGARIHGAPVLGSEEAAGIAGAVHLAAVGQPGGRDRVRAEAARFGLVDGRELWAVA